MTDSNGEHDDDPQLRSLRAVWLSLPDEEPPAGGLAELMAAARNKAATLAAPPWWRRVLEALRRPPIMALATVTVLIGGAVLVSSHKDELAPAPTATPVPASASSPAQERAASGSSAAPATGGRNDESGGGAPGAEATSPKAERGPSPPAEKSAPKVSRHISDSRPRKGALESQQAPKDRSSDGDPASLATGAAPSGADSAHEEADKKAVSAPKQDAAIRDPVPPSPEQLLAQCRSAAGRGDCASARTLALRIARANTSYYNQHVANDVAIMKCVAPSPAATQLAK